MELAHRLNLINEPQTIAMAKLGRELAAKGHDLISLSLGEPDFVTPKHIIDAAKQAMDDGFTFYTPVAGNLDLRIAICDKLKRENNLTFLPENILVATGAKQALMDVVMALINEGDEVVIPTPYWVSYSEMVSLMHGKNVFIHAPVEQNYKITPQQLAQAITAKTKAFIFSSPCNPTGSVYNKNELEALAEVFRKNPHVYIISDEIYEHINFIGSHYSLAQFDDLKDRVIIINGMSKGYAMTGWRIGYVAAHSAIIKGAEKIQSQYTSGTNAIAQKASVAALNGPIEPTLTMQQAYKRRRDLVLNHLSQINGLVCNKPDGAFYVFPDVSYFFGKTDGNTTINNATDFCMYVLNTVYVSMVTGEAFGAPNCVRISYATSETKLEEALKRIKQVLDNLK